MYAWWALDEVRQRQERAAGAAARRAAYGGAAEKVTRAVGRGGRLHRRRRPADVAVRRPGGNVFVIPGFAASDWSRC